MRRLVEVHKVHVDFAPRQILVELRVQMEQRFGEDRQAAPHFGGRKGVHPRDDSATFRIIRHSQTQGANFFGRGDNGFENDFKRQAWSRLRAICSECAATCFRVSGP